MGQPPEGLHFEGTPFAPNPLVTIAAPSHPLSLRRGLNPEDLADQRSSCESRALEPAMRWIATSPITACMFRQVMEAEQQRDDQASRDGRHRAGLSVASHGATGTGGRARRGARCFGLPLRRQWYVVHSRQRRLTPAADEFLQYLLREADGLMRAAL